MGRIDPELTETCRREYPRLVGLVALHVGDRTVAEELVQEALVQLCRQWERVEHPHAWLTRVAVNLANSWLRRRIAERRAYGRHGVPAEGVDELDRADVVAVRQAVAALPPRQRTVVALRFYERLSVAETADVMGCAQGTVKALTHRAIGQLKQAELFESLEVVEHA